MENNKNYSIPTIVTTVLVVIIIFVLAGLLYYFSVKPVPSVPASEGTENSNKTVPEEKPAIPEIVSTNVINFIPPETLPTDQKSGYCWVNSIAQPFRKDAWRCQVLNEIYDPCFETAEKGKVFCQMNPLETESFSIKLTKLLPKPDVSETAQTNWAWFLQLKDGTYCSPFTGTRPFFGNPPDIQVAYYGCNSADENKRIVLLGDLTEGVVWGAEEAILTKTGGVPSGLWTINSSQRVDVSTVWK